jgi:hypothetical protein
VQNSLEQMKVALRVLTAIRERVHPDPADVEILRKSIGNPELAQKPPDELACDVIQMALKIRAERRKVAAT